MPKIFLIRVCETVANMEGKISNFTPLTPNGIIQSDKVANRLRNVGLSAIYSSSLESASKTALIIAQQYKISIVEHSEFNETYLGDWDGMTKKDIVEKYPHEWKEWLDSPNNSWRFPGARETLVEARTRAMKRFNQIIHSHSKDDIICIVTHGNIIRFILCSLLDIDLSKMLAFHQFNGAITALEVSGNESRISFVNDICHLLSLGFSDSITGKPWAY